MGAVVLRLAFGLAVFAIVIYFVDLSQAVVVLLELDMALVAAACACLLASRIVVAFKWWVLLGGRSSSVGYAAVQRAVLLADYQALLFPNTLVVDALKLVLLRHHERGLTYTASTIVADRIVNVMVAAATALIGMLVLTSMALGESIPPSVTTTVLVLACTLLAAGFAIQSDRLFRIATWVLDRLVAHGALRRHVHKIIAKAEELHRSMTVLLAEPATLLKAIGLSLLVLLLRTGVVFFLLVAADLLLDLILLLAVYPIIMLIALLPITVLGIGVQDGAFVFFLGGIGVPAATALAVSIAFYAAILAVSLVAGLLGSLFGPALPRAG